MIKSYCDKSDFTVVTCNDNSVVFHISWSFTWSDVNVLELISVSEPYGFQTKLPPTKISDFVRKLTWENMISDFFVFNHYVSL